MESKKKKWYRGTYLQSRNRDIYREQMCGHREGKGGTNWEIKTDIYTLRCIK